VSAVDLSTPTPPDNPSSPTVWRLELPFPAPPLRDNGRYHWAVKARVTRELREQAHWLAHHYRLPRGLPFAVITLCWQPGVNRRRDPLSITPTLKPLVDGLVDYGLVADDDIGHARLGCDIRGSVARGSSRCWLDITEATR
jgi:hypothetical protein